MASLCTGDERLGLRASLLQLDCREGCSGVCLSALSQCFEANRCALLKEIICENSTKVTLYLGDLQALGVPVDIKWFR